MKKLKLKNMGGGAMTGNTNFDQKIADKAQNLVDGDRQKDYGNPVQNWTNIAKVWSGILGKDITPEQAILCIIGMKLTRESFKSKEDNRVDAVGYLEILERVTHEKRGNMG